MSATDGVEVDDNRWRNRLLSSPLWLVALLPILPPLLFFAYASWEPGCVSVDDGTVDVFRLGTGITIALQVGVYALLGWKLRDRPGLGGIVAVVAMASLFVGGWIITSAVADAVGQGTDGRSC